MSVVNLVLAAGASTRMGSPKALLELDGVSFFARIAQTAKAAGAGSTIAVLGPPDGDAIKRRLPVGVGYAWNHDPSRGMLSSVQAGLLALPHRTLAILIWPVDLPEVRTETVRQILGAAPGKVIVPRHQGKGGHPVRVPARLFGALTGLDPDKGLRAFLDGNRAEVVDLGVDDPAIATDIDTPQDLAKAQRRK